MTQRNDGGGAHGTGSASTREAQLRAQKAFIPLRRAVHNDREKLAKITHAATELKLTDPSLAVNIRNNLHSESGIQNLGALRTTSIPHLLGFQFSVEPGFTGTAKTPDSLDMSDFMPAPKNGSRFEFRTIAEQVSAFEHLKRVPPISALYPFLTLKCTLSYPFFFRRSSVHLGVRKRVKPK